MSEVFTKLSNTDLQSLIAGLQSQRIAPPYTELQLSRVLASDLIPPVSAGLSNFKSFGFSYQQIATVLELLVKDRIAGRTFESQIDLVTSGPVAPGISNRDTSVVVRELFAHALNSVLVVGYAVYQGQHVFAELAKRMEEQPDLDVKLFLNISRPDRDTSTSEILISRYTQRFKDSQWPPGSRLPEVYYDPRSVDDKKPVRSSLHAKCVVVDSKQVFVSSANFTEAGQERNIEVGLGIHSDWIAGRITKHFKCMYENGLLMRAF